MFCHTQVLQGTGTASPWTSDIVLKKEKYKDELEDAIVHKSRKKKKRKHHSRSKSRSISRSRNGKPRYQRSKLLKWPQY